MTRHDGETRMSLFQGIIRNNITRQDGDSSEWLWCRWSRCRLPDICFYKDAGPTLLLRNYECEWASENMCAYVCQASEDAKTIEWYFHKLSFQTVVSTTFGKRCEQFHKLRLFLSILNTLLSHLLCLLSAISRNGCFNGALWHQLFCPRVLQAYILSLV